MLIVTLSLGGLGWAVFEATRSEVLAEIRRDVRARGRALAQSVERGARGQLLAPDLDVFTTPDTYIEVTTPDGKVLKHSSNLQDHQLPFLQTAFQKGRVAEANMGDVPMVVYGSPVRLRGGLAGYVVVGRSPGPLYQVLHRLRGVLISGTALVLVLTGVAVWFMVRAAMGPLVRLASAAADIAHSQDHSGRVGVAPRSDEVGQLATTINGMLNALENIHREIEEANAAQRRFLTDVSHELRAPLTIMLSSLELLQKVGSRDPEFRDRALADTRAEAERVARMVTQLLIMARTGTHAAAANKPLLIGEMIGDLCRKWSHRNGERTLRCREVDGLEEAVINGNEDYLRQLFFILLDNAFKFTPEAGVVEIHGAALGDVVEISVIDTGRGIAPGDLPYIFDRFYRGKMSGSGESMGLGLSIARHIAQQHGGKVEVQSEVGKGTRFTVTLPLMQ
jgi:signal transduction histidine kinase